MRVFFFSPTNFGKSQRPSGEARETSQRLHFGILSENRLQRFLFFLRTKDGGFLQPLNSASGA